MEGKKRVAPGEVSLAVKIEYEAVVTTNGEKSAEAIVQRGLQASRKGMNFRKSAERTLRNILPYIEDKLFLKVNREKTCVAHISKVKYLGYTFYNRKGFRFRVHPKSVEKMKKKIRELTNRNNGWSNETRILKLQQYIRGWVNYFKRADMKRLLWEIDEWMRHRIRAIYWKQWKKVRTRIKKLRSLNLPERVVFEIANSSKGIWRSALILNTALTNKEIAKLGYMSLVGYYLQVCET